MNRSQEEEKLKDLFQRLKRHDQQTVRSFDQVLTRRRSSRSLRGSFRIAFAALAIGLAVLVALHSPGRKRFAVTAISDWRSPTEVFLKVPGRELLNGLPRFGAPTSLIPIIRKNKEDL